MNKTISDDYLKLQKKLHENPNYGVASIKFAPNVKTIVEDAKLYSISDYGAGKKNLQKRLMELGLKDFEYYPYDPAFPEYGQPKEADLVCCIDVLEHAEENYLDNILDDLKKITKKFGFYTIHTGPAAKVLADGRNAHLIQKPPSWWLPKMCNRFEIKHMQEINGGFILVTMPKI
tara:strand:+ start:3311 stop:3835 length:525 start_codon:yes stop_codon:yes gene_type:complete